ncbi:hypothetical protein HY640_00555 [Candidatus Woesearchaeota archaeon]|nr:hypothetical protein [Candidatus Woesearchaeota archaeon]
MSGIRLLSVKGLGRRAVAPWVSYVLLVGLSVVLGVIVLNWSRGFASSQGSDLKDRAEASAACENLGVRLDKICQNTQTLNMNVTNNNNRRLDGLSVLMVDIYDAPQLRDVNVIVKPEEKAFVRVVKQGIVKRVEVTPSAGASKRVMCPGRKVVTETIPICSA